MKRLIYFVLFASIVVIGIVLFNPSTATGEIAYDRDVIIVPVNVQLVDDGTVKYTTNRDLDDIIRIFEGVNEMWAQGRIEFLVENVEVVSISSNEFESVLAGDFKILAEKEGFKSGMINGYFARYINANGMSFSSRGMFLIADLLTFDDHRTTAHELGHTLGLRHSNIFAGLMFNGSDGETLSKEEIEIARENARGVFEIKELRINEAY